MAFNITDFYSGTVAANVTPTVATNVTPANGDPYGLPPVNYGLAKPDNLNAAVLERQDALYRKFYIPQERELIQQLGNFENLNDVRKNAGKAYDTGRQSFQRNLRRNGITLSPSESAAYERKSNADRALSVTDTVNNTRLDNKEREISLRNALINVGRGVQEDGASSLGEAGIRAANRDASYKVAKEQYKTQQQQMFTSLAGSALLAFAL